MGLCFPLETSEQAPMKDSCLGFEYQGSARYSLVTLGLRFCWYSVQSGYSVYPDMYSTKVQLVLPVSPILCLEQRLPSALEIFRMRLGSTQIFVHYEYGVQSMKI